MARHRMCWCFFCRLLIFFKINLLEKFFQDNIRVSNRFDLDQVRHLVGPDLGPNCLQKLSADDTRRQSSFFSVGPDLGPNCLQKLSADDTKRELMLYFIAYTQVHTSYGDSTS